MRHLLTGKDSRYGYREITLHQFFSTINWDNIRSGMIVFYAPGLKGSPGASSNRIVRLSVRLSVRP